MCFKKKAMDSFRFGGRIVTVARWGALVLLLLVAIAPAAHAQWSPTWSDEFNGPVGTFPDPANWTYDVGGGGWGNGEFEVYCAAGSEAAPCSPASPNVFMDGNGNLVIRAIRSANGTWTSTRMKTQGLQQFQYGRIEARIKLPFGKGLWPAFWMLGTNIPRVGWPNCGESDIMEWFDLYPPTATSSTDHGPGYSGGNGIGSLFPFPNGGRIDDATYHIYGVIWSPYQMRFYRDDWTTPFLTITPAVVPPGNQWVFNHPFFLLLNEAVGSFFFPGPDATTPVPADMLVDYVRVMAWNNGAPETPRSLRAKTKASNQIEIQWEAGQNENGGSDASDSYDIYASTTPNFQPSFSNLVVQHYHGTHYVHQGLGPTTTYYYQVRAVGLGGESASSNEDSATTEPFGDGQGIAIHAGGYAVENFASEMFSAGGFTNFHNVQVDTSLVENPAPQAVYQTEHWGASDWAIPNLNPRADYTLRLHFVENTFTAAGKRKFNVIVNGEQVLSDFDIVAAAGAMSRAVTRDFVVTPDENGVVAIQFVPGSADQPTVSGIELILHPEDDEGAAQVVVGSAGGTTESIAINSGGPAVGAFLADTDFAGGRIGSSSTFVDLSGVTDPAPEEVYLTQRVGTGVGSFGYFIPGFIPGAAYNVRLHFAEGFFKSAGSRAFNVAIDGKAALTNFDIFATAGAVNKAVIEEFPVRADRYGLIMLQFLVGSSNVPSIRGVEIIETTPTPGT